LSWEKDAPAAEFTPPLCSRKKVSAARPITSADFKRLFSSAPLHFLSDLLHDLARGFL